MARVTVRKNPIESPDDSVNAGVGRLTSLVELAIVPLRYFSNSCTDSGDSIRVRVKEIGASAYISRTEVLMFVRNLSERTTPSDQVAKCV